MNCVIVGSVALDSVRTPHGEVERALGGSAVYASIAASRFTCPGIVGVVGDDFPKEHIALLKKKKVNLEGLQIVSGKTFHWKGYYEGDLAHAHTISTDLNVFASFEPVLPETYRNAEFLFLANIDPVLQMHVLEQVKKPRLVVCDTMNFWINGRRNELLEVLRKIDVFVLNEGEAWMLTDTRIMPEALDRLLKLGPSCVIIKEGRHGALMKSRNDYFTLPAYLLREVKDTTGAGDTFAGGFIGYLASRRRVTPTEIRRGMIMGTILSSFVCQDFSIKATASLTDARFASRCEEYGRYARIPNLHF